jgi:hypothetical protein
MIGRGKAGFEECVEEVTRETHDWARERKDRDATAIGAV